MPRLRMGEDEAALLLVGRGAEVALEGGGDAI
jgi:hypothetical protein